MSLPKYRFFDIAANLADAQFSGAYHGKQVHEADLDEVIKRSQAVGCDRLLVVGGYLEDCKQSFQIAQKNEKFYCTVGVHPCRVSEVENFESQEKYIQELEKLIAEFGDKFVAIGECGLDYDRLEFSSKEIQLKHFPFHFDLAQKYNKPMYLHNRNTGGDFVKMVKEHRHKFPGGVVHSFTGDLEEAKQILELDLFIGINGCSLKSKENLDVVKEIPLDKIMLETDCPYCEIRNTHAGANLIQTKFPNKKADKFEKGVMVKSRNEPCNIIQVAEVVAKVKGVPVEELTEAAYKNTLKLFNLPDPADTTSS